MHRLSAALVLILLAVLVPTAHAQDQRCFPETGQCISGRIREYWEQNGGLPVFGFPTTDQHEEQIEGKPFQVQWFERNRLELHPENARLQQLGVDDRLIVSEPFSDLPGLWVEIPQSTVAVAGTTVTWQPSAARFLRMVRLAP